MALIRAKRLVSIVTPAEFDNSRILNIKEVKYKPKINEKKQHGKGIQKRERSTKREKVYVYEFFFYADLRKALDSKFLSLRFTVRKKSVKKRHTFVSGLRDKSSKGIAGSLRGKLHQNKKDIVKNDRDNNIYRRKIDLTKQFNNKLLKRHKNLTDRELFGMIEKIVPAKRDQVLGAGKNIIVAQRNVLTVNNDYVDSMRSFRAHYANALYSSIDPGSILGKKKAITPGDPKLEGTWVSSRDENSQLKRKIRNSIEAAFTKSNEDLYAGDILSRSDVENIGVKVKVVNKKRLIRVKVRLRERDLFGKSTFLVTIDAMDKKGIIGQTMTLEVDHAQNIRDYYVPRKIPTLKVSSSFASQKASVWSTVVSPDKKRIRSVHIVKRSITEVQPLIATRFEPFVNISQLDDDGVTLQDRSKKSIIRGSSHINQFRALPISKGGELFGNFSSEILKYGPYQNSSCVVTTIVSMSGIRVRADSLSPNVIGVSFLRRDLTANQRKFITMKYSPERELDENEAESELINSSHRFVSPISDRKVNYSIIDKSVRKGHTYEYRVKLYLDSGISRLSAYSSTATYAEPMGLVAISCKNVEVTQSRIQRKGNIGSASSGIISKVKFDIEYELTSSDTDVLLGLLQSAGLEDFYSTDLEEIKQQFQNLVSFGISRQNLLTGEVENVGMFAPGEVLDDGSASYASPPQPGSKYRYRIDAYLVSPEDAVVSETASIAANAKITSIADLRLPSTFTSLRTTQLTNSSAVTDEETSQADEEDYASTKVIKYYSVPALVRGTIASQDAMLQNHSNSSLGRYGTGDFIFKNIRTGSDVFDISSASVSYGGGNTVSLRWKASDSGAATTVDFFIILCTKQGATSVIGCCHAHESGIYNFVDLKHRKYVGYLSYSVVAIHVDGQVGTIQSLGSILLHSSSRKYRRRN